MLLQFKSDEYGGNHMELFAWSFDWLKWLLPWP